MTKHFMLLPCMACQAQCVYCFGPNHGPNMPPRVVDAALDWIAGYLPAAGRSLEIVFHGGEPLLAGKDWYRRNLPLLQRRFEGRLKLGIQSNLWLLDDEFCALFKDYGVSVGTSLDGPEQINDHQRGEGYFARTMAGINTARRFGLLPGVICTFTRASEPHYREVFEFFAEQGLPFSVHEAVCALGSSLNETQLSPSEAADLMVNLFEYYLENITRAQIPSFDAMARGLSAQTGALCTFGDCLGQYLTIAPGGEIFSCNRFVHHPEWKLGSVFDCPDEDALARSPAWQKLRQREVTVREDCRDCTHFETCKGGCAYNAVTAGVGQRDPHCSVYRRLFDHITARALDEVFSEKNMDALVTQGSGGNGWLRKGRLIQLMKGELHPREVARKARETVAAVALACSTSTDGAVEKLERAGIVTHRETALGSLRSLRERLDQQPQLGLVNAYLHLTYACNLACSHCYAQAGPGASPAMDVTEVDRLVRQSAAAGFQKIVITGGEPLVHPQRDALLDSLALLRMQINPARLVLRTNLAYALPPELQERLARCADRIVVSVDGDEITHDARRGAGSYARTVANLRRLLECIPAGKILLTAVLDAGQIEGTPGEALRSLGNTLGLQVRFKPILPIGRGADLNLTHAGFSSEKHSGEALAASPGPTATCGLGKNLYVGPCGESYPCYALMGSQHLLGNALEDGLAGVLKQNDRYRQATVDHNPKCRACALRYLCGGYCRAWSVDDNFNTPSVDCTVYERRARAILLGALETLNCSTEQWREAGLPQ